MGGGAWPFLVGGVICLVNSVNERDLILLNSDSYLRIWEYFLEGLCEYKRKEVWGNNRSVMPLDVLGCTRATLMHSTSLRPCLERLGNLFKMHRDGDRLLQLLIFNEEFLVSASHQLVLITSLPFVHTARRSYRLSDPVNNSDCSNVWIPNVVAESLVNLIT